MTAAVLVSLAASTRACTQPGSQQHSAPVTQAYPLAPAPTSSRYLEPTFSTTLLPCPSLPGSSIPPRSCLVPCPPQNAAAPAVPSAAARPLPFGGWVPAAAAAAPCSATVASAHPAQLPAVFHDAFQLCCLLFFCHHTFSAAARLQPLLLHRRSLGKLAASLASPPSCNCWLAELQC